MPLSKKRWLNCRRTSLRQQRVFREAPKAAGVMPAAFAILSWPADVTARKLNAPFTAHVLTPCLLMGQRRRQRVCQDGKATALDGRTG